MALSQRAIPPALSVFLVFSPSNAAETVPLERVLQIARDTAPAIAAARARAIQAEGRSLTERLLPDPMLVVGAGRGEPRDGGPGVDESSVELGLSIPAPWTLRDRGRSGSASIQAARDEVEAVTAEIVLEAKRLYYEAAIGEAQAAALADSALDAATLRDLMARRVEAGEAPEVDRLRTRVEALRAELDARDSAADTDGARAALDRLLLGALGPDFRLSADLDPRLLPIPPENLVALTVSGSPAYRAALSRVEAARWADSVERGARLPGFDLSVFHEKEMDRRATGATLGLTLPLWNRNRARIAVTGAELVEAESIALDLRSRLEADVERLARRDRAARDIAIAYQQDVLPPARESLAIARFSVEEGEASLLSWLDARRSYLEVLRASYEAQLQAFQRRAELERLTGEIHATQR